MPEFSISPSDTSHLAEAEQKDAHDEKEYGCIFCITGRELAVAQRLERTIPKLKVIVPVKLRYRRMGGMKHEERVILFPGYVFFEAQSDSDVEIRTIDIDQDVLKVLYVDDEEKDWKLTEPDKKIVKLFFDLNGVVGFSKAYFDERARIHIRSGFLKDYEGRISRVNRRARTAEIRININEKAFSMWLGFEESDCV